MSKTLLAALSFVLLGAYAYPQNLSTSVDEASAIATYIANWTDSDAANFPNISWIVRHSSPSNRTLPLTSRRTSRPTLVSRTALATTTV
jgi:hypothetical protein